MTNALPLSVTLGENETAFSFATRLSKRNGASSLSKFCKDIGLPMDAIAGGESAAIEELARLGGVSPAKLGMQAIRFIRPGRYQVGRHEVPVIGLRLSRPRVCPQCVLDDEENGVLGGTMHRVQWAFASIRTCPLHDMPLIEPPRELGSSDSKRTFDSFVSRGDNARNLTQKESRKASGLEKYLCNRINSIEPGIWMDQFNLSVVGLICERVGMGMKRGVCRAQCASEDEKAAYGAAGFQAMWNGYATLEPMLLNYLFRLGSLRRTPSADLIGFIPWISSMSGVEEYRPAIELFEKFVHSHFKLTGEKQFLGRSLPDCNQMQSVNARAWWAGRTREIAGSGDAIGLETLSDSQALLSRDVVCAVLGCNSSDLDSLVASKQLKPFCRIGTNQSVFKQSEVFNLLELATSKILVSDQIPEAFCRLGRLNAEFDLSLGEVLELGIGGDIAIFLPTKDQYRLSQILVDPKLARMLIETKQNFTPSEAAKRLLVTAATVRNLIKSGFLSAHKQPENSEYEIARNISKADIETFNSSYVSIRQLCRELRWFSSKAEEQIALIGAKAVLPAKPYTPVYKRADLHFLN